MSNEKIEKILNLVKEPNPKEISIENIDETLTPRKK
jgi:hypothetical protein